MTRLKSLPGILLPAMFALLLVALPASADEDNGQTELQSIMISVNSKQGQIQGTAMTLASTLAQRDKEVRVLLCGEAAELALEENIPTSLRPRDVSPKEMMMEAISFGARIEICDLFLPNSRFGQYDEGDLVDEVGIADPEDIADYMVRPDVRTFSY